MAKTWRQRSSVNTWNFFEQPPGQPSLEQTTVKPFAEHLHTSLEGLAITGHEIIVIYGTFIFFFRVIARAYPT